MQKAKYLPIKISEEMYQTISSLASKSHISNSEMVRRLIKSSLDKELTKSSIDFVREQIREEIKNTCFPQFNRIAKLEAKIGYQSISNFYLLSYLISDILPASKRIAFAEIQKKSKAMAISYLQLKEKDFLEFIQSEDISLYNFDLRKEQNNES